MKKIILVIIFAAFSAGIMSAQTMAEATETYNQAVVAIQGEDYNGALSLLQQALTAGEALGEEGAELVNNCKTAIPNCALAVAKNLIKDSKYDDAVTKLGEVAEVAEKYGNADVVAEAKELVPQVFMQKGNEALKAKDYVTAAAGYKQAMQADTTNGTAALRLGQVLSLSGKTDEALDAFQLASERGEAEDAQKQISTLYLKKAASLLKSSKYADAIAAAEKCQNNAQAYLIAGQASQKLNKNSDAIKYFTKYLEASPNASNASAITFTVAALYQKSNNKAKAIEYYQKVASDAKFGAQAKQMLDALKK